MEKLRQLLLDTLHLILLPNKLDESLYLAEIEEKLNELEGDYYTFLNNVNLRKLSDSNLIDSDIVVLIDEIRQQISNVKPSLWNPTDFIKSHEWFEIREKVKDVLARI